MLKRLFLLATFLLLPTLAVAEGRIELISLAEVEVKVTNDKGEEELVRFPAAERNVGPGDIIIFTNVYGNKRKEPAEAVVINNPVPQHMVYVEGSAEGEGATIDFSIDGGKTFGQPEELKIKGPDGSEVLARPEDYTHIRWRLKKPVAPGEQGTVAFRARIR